MSKKRILIVDDEAPILDMYVAAFERSGYDVTAVNNAHDALREMKRRSYPLVISDLNMPGMDGVELCRRIRKDYPMTMVIAVTGYASLFELSDCRDAGFEDYFIKPVRLKELIDEIDQCFTKHDRWRQRLVDKG